MKYLILGGNPNFKDILVYADPVDNHAKYHKIDKLNMLVADMKKCMKFIFKIDPTVDNLPVYNAVVQEYANKLRLRCCKQKAKNSIAIYCN